MNGSARFRNIQVGGTAGILSVTGNGTLRRSGSSRRYKKDIKKLEADSSKVFELKIVKAQQKKISALERALTEIEAKLR